MPFTSEISMPLRNVKMLAKKKINVLLLSLILEGDVHWWLV